MQSAGEHDFLDRRRSYASCTPFSGDSQTDVVVSFARSECAVAIAGSWSSAFRRRCDCGLTENRHDPPVKAGTPTQHMPKGVLRPSIVYDGLRIVEFDGPLRGRCSCPGN